jgi:Spy/CpxP family protein refolding chaperone
MKRILIPICILSTALILNTSCEDRGTTTEVVSANEDENVNPSHIRGYGDREPGGAPPSSPEADKMYGFEVDRYSGDFADDMNLDNNLATEMVKIYYDRSRQLSDLEQRYQYSETTKMGGQTQEGETQNKQPLNEADVKAERERINKDTDKKVKEILSPEQYKDYEKNRSKYHKMKLNE